ncbi:indolepyruvate ferredoxin oxidoreductase alpha subunit [Ruminiclostridium sufflavum DSM 19573]|uniref:Indolepyruvate oxidoreductase subunit IorA n=1 Tax=Ruminiclostridium sufflavum DSM 19573 TaxID=1121337 RepID=A0A318XJ56_9FIRM|nr:indolepyruvate ferredoxin oxidoreductase subunit alpha [Ruminiclostridium sufflavum]PYG87044.1 indolepyruvate ferredoxin oxidoreductase alpha subunit [Ruminiclostridium sufflavum DSM 19573]
MKKLMLGNEAVARGAYEAGCTVASAYPGTPSTEITETIAKEYNEIYSEWAPNEKVAMEVAIGASFGGARAICAMKHVGLNVAADPLFTVSYTGVNGGLVIMVADDPGMHSSQNEQDSRNYARASKVPMLEPSDSQECKDFVKKAFSISEQFDTPVMVRLSTRIAHSQSIVEINDKEDYKLKEYVKDAGKYVMMPAMAKKRHVAVEKRMADLRGFSDTIAFNRLEMNSSETGVITSGIAYQYVKEAMPDASVLKLGMVYPVPEKLIADFASRVKTLYVVEELEPFFEEQILKMGIKVIGKEKLPVIGELSSKLIAERLMGKAAENSEASKQPVPVRPPVMCPGCPHRGMFYVLKKLKLNVSGDIGCYTLGALAPNESIDTCVCMGASIGVAHGMEKARGAEFGKKTVAILGDSTFIHSGITGLIDIVYNKGNSTVLILDNSITGMTGHQQNPTTGFTIKGEPTKQVDLELLCKAVGIERVSVVDPFDIKEFEKVVKRETAADEPSVIISQRPCALLKNVRYEGVQEINQDKCKKCRMCMKIGCPAIVDKGEHLQIDTALCVGCKLCTKVCGFNAIEKADK